MTTVSSLEFQKNLQGEVLVSSAQPGLMGRLPGFMVLAELGTTFPFSGNQERMEHSPKGRVSKVKDFLTEKSPLGRPLTITASPADTTPLLPVQKLVDFDWGKYTPLKKYQHRALTEKPGWTMFPAFVPANAYTTDSCALLSEIQRHMLEKVIDGGLTWSDLWTKSEVQKFFNNRLTRFYLETGVIQEEFSVPVTAFTSEYDYPTDLVQAKRLSFEEDLSLYDGLVSFWRLEEATGSRRDAFGPNHLTAANSPTNAIGKIGNAYNGAYNGGVGGTSVYITNANQSGLNPGIGDFSISMWIYPYSFESAGSTFISTIIGRGAVGAGVSSPGYTVSIYGDLSPNARNLAVGFGDNASAFPYMQSHPNHTLELNTWQHLVFIFDRDAFLQTYINNQRAFARNDGGSDDMNFFGPNQGESSPAAPFVIGGLGQNQNPTAPNTAFSFNGRIDAVGFWNRTLTKAEVATLYNGGNGRELYIGQHDGPYVVLPRVDPFTQDNSTPGWESSTGTPSVIIEEPRSPLSFQLSPKPDTDGSVEGIYVAEPDDISDACTILPIPNFLTWIIKYGVMSDMLRKEGEANDPQRAEYCERRWKEGVALTRILLGFGEEGDNENE